MDKEVLEVVLKRFSKELKIASIIAVEVTSALPEGENFASAIKRLELKVVLGNGRLAKKSLILKTVIDGEASDMWLKLNNIFNVESQIYSLVLKEMTYLMEEFEDTEDTLWCKFIHYDPKTYSILLEDLKARGYSMVPRQKGMDLEHAMLTMRGLGRYHGMAKVLEERGIISKDNYRPNQLFTDEKLIRCFNYAGVINTAKVMQESWDLTWTHIAKEMMVSFEKFAKKQMELGKCEESEFTVLNHGDCWSNNMMFKYDFKKRPISVKFVDYQFPHYNTPCMDLTNIMYLSIQPHIRRSNFSLLLETYHHSLFETLEKFNFRGAKPTLQDLTATMDRLQFFGLALFATWYPSLLSTKALSIDKLLETDGQEGFNSEVLREPGIVENMGPDIIDLVEKHLRSL